MFRRGDEPPRTFPDDSVALVPHRGWWSAFFNSSGKDELYVDINTPPVWNGPSVVMIDLDLDVARRRSDGSTQLLDEDEFADHQVKLDYPPSLIDGARAAAASLFLAVERRDEPFGSIAEAWFEAAAAVSDLVD